MVKIDVRDRQIAQTFKEILTRSLGTALESVVLFGSRAQGQALPDSDMDILVVVRDSPDRYSLEKKIIDTASEVSLKFDIALIPLIMNHSHYQKHLDLNTGLLQSIQRAGIPL